MHNRRRTATKELKPWLPSPNKHDFTLVRHFLKIPNPGIAMCTHIVLIAIRLGIIAIITSYIGLSVQVFKAKQIVSETTPDFAMGWIPTATIVLSSMILPLYLYSVIMGLSRRSGWTLATLYIFMGLLGAFNLGVALENVNGIHRVIGQKDDEDITECIYPTLCPFTSPTVILGYVIMSSTTVVDVICYWNSDSF